MKGVVVKSTGSWYEVRQEDGSVIQCRLRGQFRIKGIKNTNPVVVGDFVQYELEKDGNGWITTIEPRKNYIDRKSTKLSKISHLIASNIDQAFLVVTLKEPRTSLGFIDRFLLAAEGFRIPVCLVFNKIDIYSNIETLHETSLLNTVDELEKMYAGIGYQTLRTSTVTGEGIESLKQLMQGKTVLFSGHSGVGKSALIKAVAPEMDIKIGEISSVHNKGKHTTTFAQMYYIESVNGFIIDTPGIKEFGLIQYSKEEIRDYFPEIRQYNNCCRFDNCLHVHEPGCAVLKAVEEGKIPSSRYLNYLAILQDDDLKIADWKLL
ncbi:MAG: ribosome small subunit-dependent GTPase A [Bacteroidales bacterium]|jgi:ribosome biogenesis GTPase|nr:ribosome small subunit-dependent GTPase A [Bacteroidota bacterium]MBQ9509890.1 ribosome small subunit-dependent GTPase A [Bacteroidales bacterium]MBR6063901.1 ribosome small subunit-dependent GTPase A [Bacteroidales bacterium]